MIRRLPAYQKLMLALLALAVLVLDGVMFNLHSADDEDHFGILYAASHLNVGPVASPDPAVSSGNYVDAAIPKVIADNYHAVRFETKPVRLHTEWTGRQVFFPLPASVYLPLVYLPQMVAVRMGEGLGLSVENTILLARVFNGMAALGIIAAALAFLPEGLAVFVLVILSMPKSLQVFASNSGDPMDHAITIALIAFFCRVMTSNWKPRTWHFALAALGVLALGGVRPPMAAIGLPLLYAAHVRKSRAGMAMAVAAMVLAVGWWGYALPIYHDVRCPISATLVEKAMFFATHAPAMLIETLQQRSAYYWGSFIGELGYGDARIGFFAPYPTFVYLFTSLMLGLGVAAMGREKLRIGPAASAVNGLAAIAMTGGIFFSLSLACTTFGNVVIDGVQGRYFVTPLLLLAVPAAALIPRWQSAERIVQRALPVHLGVNLLVMVAFAIKLYWLP